ncbi:MAG: S-methyl-5-thioribose-1-phosphate isomerase [Pirellulales bacterium]
MQSPQTLQWIGHADGHVRLIDQTRLPAALTFVDCHDTETVWQSIRALVVRGAPAIGIAAAYGVVLAARQATSVDELSRSVHEAADYLATSRPTAVNLFWALDRMRRCCAAASAAAANRAADGANAVRAALLTEAQVIHDEDRRTCQAIGQHGAALLRDGDNVLTHCNAGALATGGDGTALAVIFAAAQQGKHLHVWVDETRPLWQGARLTAWELMHRGIAATLITDSMAAHVMSLGKVQAVVVGADRIAANGDTANKIGTYAVALAAAAHDIPFYVAAPTSTFDLSLASGAAIPIEQRPAAEIAAPGGLKIAPDGVAVYNPAFDVTPARLIRGIICETGLISPVSREAIAQATRATSSAST